MQNDLQEVHKKCPVCGHNVTESRNTSDYEHDRFKIPCEVCGPFLIDGTPRRFGLDQPEARARAHELSGLIREHCETGGMLHIKSLQPDDVDELLSGVVPKTAQEKADKLLQALARPLNSKHTGALITIDPETDYPWAYAVDSSEMSYYIEHLVLAELIVEREGKYRLTVKGWERVEHLKESRATSRKAFVAMPFAEELNDLYENGIKLGIENAGYEPIRVDKREFIEKGDDYIIARIKESRFVVVDLTNQSPNVCFEAGFALGLGLRIVWLCKDKDVDEKKLPFDIQQYNVLKWKDGEWEKLKNKLKYRIEATIGLGPVKLPTGP
jgi:hypothetical protein